MESGKGTGFDVEEAKRLESLGVARKRICEDLGVSRWTLWRVLGPKFPRNKATNRRRSA